MTWSSPTPSISDVSRPARIIPLSSPDLVGNEAAYLAKCIDTTWISSAGSYVNEMESGTAAVAERKFGIATSSGTSALQLALIVAGVRSGDYVIVPDWTFAATANAVFHAGAKPLLVDVDKTTLTMDPALVKDALETFDGGRIAAIMPVHALGHPADMDRLRAVSEQFDVALIEDAAGAIGARYRGRPAGSMGDMAVFSFNGNKTITAGGGGMILTDDEQQAKLARHLCSQARCSDKYEHDMVGFNHRMTNLNAAVGVAQLERLEEILAAKRRIGHAYNEAITARDDLLPMPLATWAEHNYWLYTLLTPSAGKTESLIRHLTDKGIEARHCWRALSSQKPYADCPTFLRGVSLGITGRTVSLPSGSGLSRDDIEFVAAALNDWPG